MTATQNSKDFEKKIREAAEVLKPLTRQKSLRLDQELADRIEELARREGISEGDVMRAALRLVLIFD